nr:MAG TPA: BclA protein [Caudoviricetes sp.]
MSKSAIYTANTSAQTVAVNDIIPVGTTSRRFGCNIRQDGNTITLTGPGYYLVNASATVAPTAAGTVSVTGQKDGVAVIGATASATTTAAAESANLSLNFIVRNVGCGSSILSFALGGAESTVTNLAVTVTKL